MFYKKSIIKSFAIFTGKHLCRNIHRKASVLCQGCNVIKKRMKHRCFPVNIGKSLRTPILKILCERLLLPTEVFCMAFVDISYEDA